MEELGWHYSHTKGKVVRGHCLVSIHYCYGNISFPYDCTMYYSEKEAKKFRTLSDEEHEGHYKVLRIGFKSILLS